MNIINIAVVPVATVAIVLRMLTIDSYVNDFAGKDMVKAAAAIDCVTVMVDKLAAFLDEDDMGRLRSLLADLQLNYARQA